LKRVDPSDIAFASVKVEPEEVMIKIYSEQNNQEDEDEKEMNFKQEIKHEDEEIMLNPECGVFVKASESDVQTAEDSDFDVKMSKIVVKEKCKRRKEGRNHSVLLDCQLCDKKQMTKFQLKGHYYSCHVRIFMETDERIDRI
jgi:hypothetical protein